MFKITLILFFVSAISYGAPNGPHSPVPSRAPNELRGLCGDVLGLLLGRKNPEEAPLPKTYREGDGFRVILASLYTPEELRAKAHPIEVLLDGAYEQIAYFKKKMEARGLLFPYFTVLVELKPKTVGQYVGSRASGASSSEDAETVVPETDVKFFVSPVVFYDLSEVVVRNIRGEMVSYLGSEVQKMASPKEMRVVVFNAFPDRHSLEFSVPTAHEMAHLTESGKSHACPIWREARADLLAWMVRGVPETRFLARYCQQPKGSIECTNNILRSGVDPLLKSVHGITGGDDQGPTEVSELVSSPLYLFYLYLGSKMEDDSRINAMMHLIQEMDNQMNPLLESSFRTPEEKARVFKARVTLIMSKLLLALQTTRVDGSRLFNDADIGKFKELLN